MLTEGRLGLGTAALGRPASVRPREGAPEAMERRAHAILDVALANGIRYVDCARSYGPAERLVRSWVDARGLAPGAIAVGSKWGYAEAGGQAGGRTKERKDHSLAMLERQAQESAEILGPYLRLYQIHSATLESRVLEDGAVLDALARLKERPLLIGLTTSGPGQAETLRRALSITRGGAPLFGAVQATWNVLEPSAEEALREAKQAGWVVLVKEALANGRLTSRGEGREGSPLARLAAAHGVTPPAVAIAAALSRPWADVVVLGASTVGQLEANLAAARLRLSAEDLELLAPLREPPRRYWETRARLLWD